MIDINKIFNHNGKFNQHIFNYLINDFAIKCNKIIN